MAKESSWLARYWWAVVAIPLLRQFDVIWPKQLSFLFQDLYLLIMKDASLYHKLEDEILKLHELVDTVELK